MAATEPHSDVPTVASVSSTSSAAWTRRRRVSKPSGKRRACRPGGTAPPRRSRVPRQRRVPRAGSSTRDRRGPGATPGGARPRRELAGPHVTCRLVIGPVESRSWPSSSMARDPGRGRDPAGADRPGSSWEALRRRCCTKRAAPSSVTRPVPRARLFPRTAPRRRNGSRVAVRCGGRGRLRDRRREPASRHGDRGGSRSSRTPCSPEAALDVQWDERDGRRARRRFGRCRPARRRQPAKAARPPRAQGVSEAGRARARFARCSSSACHRRDDHYRRAPTARSDGCAALLSPRGGGRGARDPPRGRADDGRSRRAARTTARPEPAASPGAAELRRARRSPARRSARAAPRQRGGGVGGDRRRLGGAAIGVVVGLNAALSFVQEARRRCSSRNAQTGFTQSVSVVRDGRERGGLRRAVVPATSGPARGDAGGGGCAPPPPGRAESSLTGESLPIGKSVASVPAATRSPTAARWSTPAPA